MMKVTQLSCIMKTSRLLILANVADQTSFAKYLKVNVLFYTKTGTAYKEHCFMFFSQKPLVSTILNSLEMVFL